MAIKKTWQARFTRFTTAFRNGSAGPGGRPSGYLVRVVLTIVGGQQDDRDVEIWLDPEDAIAQAHEMIARAYAAEKRNREAGYRV